MAVFVPFVLPGEKVEAEIRQEKPGFARGNVTRLIEASPDRIKSRCPYFQQCGGCHYQHIPYERQLEFKAQILRETLQRIAKIELKDEIRAASLLRHGITAIAPGFKCVPILNLRLATTALARANFSQ